MTSPRRFPTPWQVEHKVLDAHDQALVYVYARERHRSKLKRKKL
jgi:hypothetical protein